MRKPCLDCGRLTGGLSRCESCQARFNLSFERSRAMRPRNRAHYRGDYARRAKVVRETATVCWVCQGGPRPDDPWQADHVDQSNPESMLLPAHRSCNIRRANQARPSRETR